MPIRWTAHPARKRPQDVLLVVGVVLMSSWAVLVTLGSAYLAALAAVVLLASVAPFLLPTRYQLDDDGVEEQRAWTRKRRAWADLRRVEVGPGAALVSPFSARHWLDRHRGLVLYLDGADRDAVVGALRARIQP